MNDRVVVTGVGVVTSIGQTVPKFWSSLTQGLCGIGSLDIEGLEQNDVRIGRGHNCCAATFDVVSTCTR